MAVAVALEALLSDPCPRVGVTVTGLGTSWRRWCRCGVSRMGSVILSAAPAEPR